MTAVVSLPVTWLQAYQTMRKGNKKFAVFDLQVTLAWEGRWVDGDVQVRSRLRGSRRGCVLALMLSAAADRPNRMQVKGDVQLREFSSVNDPDEVSSDR